MSGISAETLQALGWTLLHFLWQGAGVAALFAASLMLCRSEHVRYALGVAALVLMMAAPALTFAWLSNAAHPAVQSQMQAAAGVTPATFADEVVASSDTLVRTVAAQAAQSDTMLWLVQAWFVGVALLAARTAGGLFWIARIRRRQIEPLTDEVHRLCLAMQRRMGLNRVIRYGLCRGLDAPLVLGWFQPIVLVTAQALTGLTVQQLQAVIAHELAHIRRFDAFVNLLQIIAETLLFYHPAVWWVSRQIRTEREVCCDHDALTVCGEPVSYARALALMEEWRTAPAISMAANRGPLTERVLRLLGLSRTSRRTRVAGIGVSALCVVAALVAGQAFVEAAQATLNEPVPQAMRQASDEIPAPAGAPVPVAAPAPVAPAAPKVAAEPAAVPKPAPAVQPKAAPQPKAPVRPIAPSEPAQPSAASEAPQAQAQQSKRSYVADLAAAGLQNLSADELIAMKVQGITSSYVEAVRASGLHPSIDELVAMKVQGITPEYIEGVLATGLHPAVQQLIAMKAQGVTSEYVREARALVIDPTVNELIAMKVHEITPQFIRDLQAAGLDARRGQDFIEAKVQGITPELIERAIEQGIGDLRLQELIELKHADVL